MNEKVKTKTMFLLSLLTNKGS